MKDSEFIELLNLYLDHEISAEDAVRLEAEVQSHPQRRRLYQDYCRMQKGCQLLAKDFVTEFAPAADRKLIAFETARPSRPAPGLYVAGGLMAAAACVAIVFMGRSRGTVTPEQTVGGTAVVAVSAPIAPAVTEEISPNAIIKVEMTPARRANLQRALVQTALESSKPANPEAAFASMEQDKQFAWIRDMRFAPIQNQSDETLKFDTRPTLRPDPQAVRNIDSLQRPREMSAFSFGAGAK